MAIGVHGIKGWITSDLHCNGILVCCCTVGHYACSLAHKMATPQDLTVFEHTVCYLAGVLSSFPFIALQSDITCAPQHTKWRPSRTYCILVHGIIFFLAGFLSSFGFVILQLDITCAPQHTKWRPVKF